MCILLLYWSHNYFTKKMRGMESFKIQFVVVLIFFGRRWEMNSVVEMSKPGMCGNFLTSWATFGVLRPSVHTTSLRSLPLQVEVVFVKALLLLLLKLLSASQIVSPVSNLDTSTFGILMQGHICPSSTITARCSRNFSWSITCSKDLIV